MLFAHCIVLSRQQRQQQQQKQQQQRQQQGEQTEFWPHFISSVIFKYSKC